MDLSCKKCGACCKELDLFLNLKDFDDWLTNDKIELISCLAWNEMQGRNPPYMLFIPKKKHLEHHKFLNKFFRQEWKDLNECLFLSPKGTCRIYTDRPSACRNYPLGKLDHMKCPGIKRETITDIDRKLESELAHERKRQNLIIYKNREMISKAVRMAKEQASIVKLARLIHGEE